MISLSDLKVKLNGSFSNSLQVKLSGSFSGGGGGGGYLADSQAYFDYIDGYRSSLAQPAMADGAKQIIDDFVRLFKGQAESWGTITAVDATVVPCGSDYFSLAQQLTFFPSVANVGAGSVWRSFIGMQDNSPTVAPTADTSSWLPVGSPSWDTRFNGTNMGLYTSMLGMVGDFDGAGWTQVYVGDRPTTWTFQERIYTVGIQGQFADGTPNGYALMTISSNRAAMYRANQNREDDYTAGGGGVTIWNFKSPNSYYIMDGPTFDGPRTWTNNLTSNCVPNHATIGMNCKDNSGFTDVTPYIWCTFLDGIGNNSTEMVNLFRLFNATKSALLAL